MTEFVTVAMGLIAVLTLVIAWLTLRVSQASRAVAKSSHEVATKALDVAIKDWKQIGREEPWSLTKLEGTYWLLERVHYDPAAIVMAEATPHCGGSTVSFMNNAGFPHSIFRRGSRIVLDIPATNVGTSLSLYYREFSEEEPVPSRNEHYFAGSNLTEGAASKTSGASSWTTVLY